MSRLLQERQAPTATMRAHTKTYDFEVTIFSLDQKLRLAGIAQFNASLQTFSSKNPSHKPGF